jgi:chorismate synthase
MGNSFGSLFRITTFGESHGPALGVVIDGCPAGLRVDSEYIQAELDRRRPGQSKIVTQRKEPDRFEIVSGCFEGVTTGAPLTFLVRNENQRSADYAHIRDAYRPSHADYTYQQKYGVRDYRGGGRSSARETLARVIAGAVAKLMLAEAGIRITAYVSQVGDIQAPGEWLLTRSPEALAEAAEASPVRCPDEELAAQMTRLIETVRKEGDTVGGVISCIITGTPAGMGEPVFSKLHADLAGAVMGINAAKGFEYGSGFEGAAMRGSRHNDRFYAESSEAGKKIRTATNFSGGVQGGISNGENIYFRVAFKPVATILQKQTTVDSSGEEIEIMGKGRHDPCVVPRAVPIVEAMAALVLADHYLRFKAYRK